MFSTVCYYVGSPIYVPHRRAYSWYKAKLIKDITNYILMRFELKKKNLLQVYQNVIGMDYHLEDIRAVINDVHIVGIYRLQGKNKKSPKMNLVILYVYANQIMLKMTRNLKHLLSSLKQTNLKNGSLM